MRKEPRPGSKERPSVWVDFYYKKNWIQTSAATSAIICFTKFQSDVAMGLFLTGC